MDPGEEEEGVGESSSPPRAAAGVDQIADAIHRRLLEIGHPEALADPHAFHAAIAAHFSRLPPSYALDMNVDKAEDALLHRDILAEAKDPAKRPVFRARFMKLEDLNLDEREDADSSGEGSLIEGSIDGNSALHSLVHEIIFSTVDKAKLLCQLSALLSDLGLNIQEAHVFSTTDGYSLHVYVVDGWAAKETDGLYKALESAIRRSEKSWYGSSQSASRRAQAVCGIIDVEEIDVDMLRFGERIAAGSCGDLYRGLYQEQEVAIKVLRPEHLNEKAEVEFFQEVQILRQLQHGNIIRFIGACTKHPQLCIVTEYMPGGNMYNFLRKQPTLLGLPSLLKFAIDVCKGMDYLHQNSIIHRDLKTANLLLDRNGVVKISDFGVARIQDLEGVMTAETGTYRWMAPEIINHQPYNQKADVFSFAIVLWELATSRLPYEGMTPMQAALGVREGRRPELPKNAHPRLLDLMHRCWEAVPARRPSFLKIALELEEISNQVTQAAVAVDQQAHGQVSKRVKGERREI